MAKMDFRRLKKEQMAAARKELWNCIETADEKKQLLGFLKDLLTPSEKLMFGRRLQVAKMLLKGKTYHQIRDALKVGETTILSVDRWLRKDCPDYRSIFSSAWDDFVRAAHPKRDPEAAFPSFKSLRQRYPLHFLFFNLLLED